MSAGKTQIQGITFRGQELECVHSYKYLGLILSSEGSMKKMEVERVTKAKRASFALRQAMSTTHKAMLNNMSVSGGPGGIETSHPGGREFFYFSLNIFFFVLLESNRQGKGTSIQELCGSRSYY